MKAIEQKRFNTLGGITIHRNSIAASYDNAIDILRDKLDCSRGVLLASSFEYPGRYTRWDLGFVDPPVVITSRARSMSIEALNPRGAILLPEIYRSLENNSAIAQLTHDDSAIAIEVKQAEGVFAEEQRCKQHSVFSVLRSIVGLFKSDEDPHLGLYGAFGYDLTFQFEAIRFSQQRDPDSREMVLYLPDEIVVVDHRVNQAFCHRYEFICRGWDLAGAKETTGGLKRTGKKQEFSPSSSVPQEGDHKPGEFAQVVRNAREYFRRGDLFEVVPGQIFYAPCKDKPSEIFQRLKESNPAPYGALINLGEEEYLVAASPEMYVRVEGKRIQTCPISGTIARGSDAISDAKQIKELLNSEKDESELSMCTDVDRNDKSRVCVPGSVEVIGRRQVELYSRLIHTVDHVQGVLGDEFDALDGFLAHTWAVTVTGAPKQAAMQFIEDNEKSPRLWYGGAMGFIGFDGNMNTGLTLRTMRIKSGVAEVRAGATLLFDSDPEAEEAETRLKASALRLAIRGNESAQSAHGSTGLHNGSKAMSDDNKPVIRALMVDHQDSFVHNLASYFRQYGVSLQTLRPQSAREYLQCDENTAQLDLVILSPGPGKPEDFQLQQTIACCVRANIPLFGVCLGLQGIVEYFGGELALLDYPMHGKPSSVTHRGGMLFKGIEAKFTAGRYHSLIAARVPDCLRITACTQDDIVMAVEHKELPISAVQFHPESIMSLERRTGHQLVANVVEFVTNYTP